MKFKNKKILVILCVLLVVIGLLLIFNPFNNKNRNNSKTNEESISKIENDITIIKKNDDFEVSEITISKTETQIFIEAKVKNITSKDLEKSAAFLILLDADGKEISKVDVLLPAIKSNETTNIKVDVTGHYGDARDFKLELKK